MKLNSILTFLWLSFLFSLPSRLCFAEAPLQAKIQGFLVTAEKMERDTENQTISLTGGVQMTYNDQHIKADKITIFLRKRQIECEGNFEIISSLNTVSGQYALLDYESNTGFITEGVLQSGPVVFKGQLLLKKSQDQYIADQSIYTSCNTCPSAWSFSGSLIRADLGSYAYIKNAVLRVGGFPILPLPYLIVPLKSDRQSGLLTPEIEQSQKGGFTFSQPFFWAINRSQDLTYTFKSYEFRGIKNLFNYRYLVSEKSGGTLDFSLLNDRVFSEEDRIKTLYPNQSLGTLNRWIFKYSHYFETDDGVIQRTQINTSSDLQYSKDFPTESLNHGDSSMENRISFSKNTLNQHLSLDTSYHINLLQSDPLSHSDESVHRFPEIRFSKTFEQIKATNIWYNFNANYVRFSRASRSYDDLTQSSYLGENIKHLLNSCNSPLFEKTRSCNPLYDGTFDPITDLLRTGQRIDWNSSVYKPIFVSNTLEVLPKITYRETYYHFDQADYSSNTRRLLKAEVGLRSNLSRIYDFEATNSRYKHDLSPEITYSGIPWIEQPSHPFFSSGRLNDVGFTIRDYITDSTVYSGLGPQFDYYDRIYDRNIYTLGISNKLTEKRYRSGVAEYRQVALFKLFQSYDAYQASNPSSLSDPLSDVSGIMDIRLDNLSSYTTFNHYPTHQLTNLNSRVRLINEKGQFFQLGISRTHDIAPGKIPDPTKKTEDYTLMTGFSTPIMSLIARVVADSNWLNSANHRIIKSWSYAAQFRPPGDCWHLTLINSQVTDGDSIVRLSFDFSFDGKLKPPPAPEVLESL